MDTLPIAAQWPKYPYRGLDFYRETDALLFRERDRDVDECAAILLRFGVKILLLQGSSGSGKSSFLRAGLLPRLARDDRNFLPLPAVRPERAAITGETGLVRSIEAALADDQPGERRAGFVLKGDQGRFAFARIFDLETRVEIGLLRFGLDQNHVGHGQHNPANLARVGGEISFLRDQPLVAVTHEGQVQARALDPDRGDLAELVGETGKRGLVRFGAADAGAAGGERRDGERREHDGRSGQQDQVAFLHGALSRLPGRLLLMPRPRDGGGA